MNAKLTQLAERREYLLEQAEKQRVALSREAEPWRIVLEKTDKGLAALRYMKHHPVWLVSTGGIMLAALGPRRIVRWLGRGLVGLQMLSRLRSR